MSADDDLYIRAREKITRAFLQLKASEFLDSYDENRPTVLLLPGGMAAQLYRYPHILGGADLPLGDQIDLAQSRLLWVSPGSLLSFLGADYASLYLSAGSVEEQRRPCFPGLALDVPFASPYPAVSRRIRAEGLNYVEVGYDWRLAPSVGAVHLRTFLDVLDDLATQRGVMSPLRSLTIVGHSYGGIIAKMFAGLVAGQADRYYRTMLAVAAPFYGTVNHANRFLVGADDLVEFAVIASITENEIQRGTPNREAWLAGMDRVRQMIASFPGMYPLLPAPASVLDAATLATLGLDGYPVRDGMGTPVDLFGMAQSFPYSGTYFGPIARSDAEAEYFEIAAPLDEETRERFYAIGGTGVGPGDLVTSATVRYTAGADVTVDPWRPWGSLKDQRPVAVEGTGHDGTVALWSARPAWLPASQFRVAHGVSHVGIIKDDAVLQVIIDTAQGAFWVPDPVSGQDRFTPASVLDEIEGLASDQPLTAIHQKLWREP